jgi:hypothetical protein
MEKRPSPTEYHGHQRILCTTLWNKFGNLCKIDKFLAQVHIRTIDNLSRPAIH